MKRLLLVLGFACVACSASEPVPSLYRPDAARQLTNEERWQLDLDLMNEIAMREHGNRRFSGENAYEARARWVEEVATWYPVADLLQQILDFRRSGIPRNNEKAFEKLVELGQSGDVSARCFAAFLYGHHSEEVTDRWRYGYGAVMEPALRQKGSPVCLGLESSLYVSGLLGYPRDEARALPSLLSAALAGSYGHVRTLAVIHAGGALEFKPRDMALNLCWKRVANTFYDGADFHGTCAMLRRGKAINSDFKVVDAPRIIRDIGESWCVENRPVSAQTCADLENALQ